MATADQLLEAALDYAGRGWPVLPLHSRREDGGCTCAENQECSSPAKHPRTRHGLKDATTDPEMIRLWWGRGGAHRGANLGIRTGDAFDVLDCDGTIGMNAFYRWADTIGYQHRGPSSLTGGGGMHVLFAPTGLGNRAKFMEGCDWRGAGGFIVAPPSVHATGKEYVWL